MAIFTFAIFGAEILAEAFTFALKAASFTIIASLF